MRSCKSVYINQVKLWFINQRDPLWTNSIDHFLKTGYRDWELKSRTKSNSTRLIQARSKLRSGHLCPSWRILIILKSSLSNSNLLKTDSTHKERTNLIISPQKETRQGVYWKFKTRSMISMILCKTLSVEGTIPRLTCYLKTHQKLRVL